ncbi:N-acetylmuramoyl-L-alanine amidase LytC [Microbacterium lemovicicum]|uniref:N-acetylmuramoyl-L-alanine amidase LytC n=1 Tax=Microbacterium lemovicicum TaxID=1072463 RepID=A0A3Q9J153_9MICO|nr:N-acetylmuramoyl-L-alanine amidase LytC [Microbacterium lemovicicum]
MLRSRNQGVVLSLFTRAHIRIRRSTAVIAAVLLVAGAMTAGSVAAPDRAEAVGSTLMPARTDDLPPGGTARISGNMDVTALLAAHPGNRSYTAWLTSEDGQKVYSVLGDAIFSKSIHFGYAGLPAGTYRVAVGTSGFDGQNTEKSPLTSVQFLRFGSGSSITLADGEQQVGLTATARSLDSRISGTLGASGLAPGATSDVAGARLYERDGAEWVRLPGLAADLFHDDIVPYSVALPPGEYTVGYEGLDPMAPVAEEWWEGATTVESAALVKVVAGQHREGVAGGVVPVGAAPATRLAGDDRFQTSAAVSAATFAPGVPVAYVTNGWKFPDALSGAAAAGALGGPVLLTDGESLPTVIADELARLTPAKIVVLGSEASVGAGVVTSLTRYATTVERTAGDDRFETSAAVSAASFSPGVPVAYLANGWKFPDALSGAAAAGTLGGPVLLTDGSSLSSSVSAELTRLKPAKIVVLGSAASVSDSVLSTARAYAARVDRLAGADRFATSAAVSAATFAPGVPVVYLANGWKFPDALSGAPAAGSVGAPVLLTSGDTMSQDITDELARLKPGKIIVLGSDASVTDFVRLFARAATR